MLQSPLCDRELVIMVMKGSNFKLLRNEISSLLLFSFKAWNELQPEEGKAAMTSNFLQHGCENNTFTHSLLFYLKVGRKQAQTKETLAKTEATCQKLWLCHGFPTRTRSPWPVTFKFWLCLLFCRLLVPLSYHFLLPRSPRRRVRLHISSSVDQTWVVLHHRGPIADQTYNKLLLQMLYR